MKNVLVVGTPIGGGQINLWHFESYDNGCKAFCETLVKTTYRDVYVIEGKEIAKFEADIPVKCTETK